VVCPSCGHKNLNEGARFCGRCGTPLTPQTEAAAVPESPPASTQEFSAGAPTSSAAPGLATRTRRPKWPIAAAVVGICAVAAVGAALALWRHQSTRAEHGPTALNNPAPAPPPAPAENHPSQPATPPAKMALGQVSATIPDGTNIAASDFGGEVESITGTYGPGHNGRLLNDGLPEPVWKPDGDVTLPMEIVFSFYKRDAALISAVVITLPKDQSAPKDVEVSTSMKSATDGFSKVAAVTLDPNSPAQAITFSPVQARYLKLNILSGGQTAALTIGEIQVIEGLQPEYVSLAARHPEIPKWKHSVRHSAQMGIDWLEPASMDWQKQNNCFGCHVQAQTIMGLSVAQRNDYVVSPSCVRDLAEFMRTKQDDDGHEKDEGSNTKVTPTQFAAMAYAYRDEVAGAKTDESLLKHVDWLGKQSKPSGELEPDHNEPPIDQGSLMATANALVAFMQVFAETGDSRYQQAADRSLSFITSAKPKTTQDKVFKVIALARFGTPQQRQLVAPLIRQLQSDQNPDGGWGETTDAHASGTLATGQVLYCFQEAGVSVDSPAFTKGVRYLLQTQKDSGAWPPGKTQSGRPSEFAPTMWAVIGLAGTLEPPTAESLKAELDEKGHVALYINFDFNKSTLRPDAKPIIAQVLKLLQDNRDLSLSIEGHTDKVGLHDYNVTLSQKRAATVVHTLVASGIRSSRLTSGGFGPDQPIADNDTEMGRAKNRRVELIKR
jgi:outer membrane protein OmpA-like peptidoglycan-associated protein